MVMEIFGELLAQAFVALACVTDDHCVFEEFLLYGGRYLGPEVDRRSAQHLGKARVRVFVHQSVLSPSRSAGPTRISRRRCTPPSMRSNGASAKEFRPRHGRCARPFAVAGSLLTLPVLS